MADIKDKRWHNKIFVFASPKSVKLINQLLEINKHTELTEYEYLANQCTRDVKFYVSGGDCNPIRYDSNDNRINEDEDDE